MNPHNLVPDNFHELLKRIGMGGDEDVEEEPGTNGPRDPAKASPEDSQRALVPSEVLTTSEVATARRVPLSEELLYADQKSSSLAAMAQKYIQQEVYGIQSENTLGAKMRDSGAFIRWFTVINGHGEIKDWMPRDTNAYLTAVEQSGKKPATINRVFATLRHFARRVNDQPGSIFNAHGLPTRGIKELVLEEPDCKKFSRTDIHRLLRAADALCMTEAKSTQRPRRNRAIFTLLYTTGLRVSELIALRRDQYDGRYLKDVRRKGRGRTRGLYIVSETRSALDDYLQCERKTDDPHESFYPLFLANASGREMTRQRVREGLVKIGQEAGKHSRTVISVHPHRLRHTFGAEYRERSGSDTETASALGHASLKYVGRYARKTDTEREFLLESLFFQHGSSGR